MEGNVRDEGLMQCQGNKRAKKWCKKMAWQGCGMARWGAVSDLNQWGTTTQDHHNGDHVAYPHVAYILSRKG